MKKLLVASIAAVTLCGSPALAADMPVKAPAYKAAEPLFNWTGFYIGGTAGWGWGKTHQTDDGTFLSPPIHWDGFVGGGTLGLNWQSGRSVLGIEADISDARIKGSIPDQPAWGCGGAGTTCHNEVKWFGTVRGRAGYAMDTFLPYVTGGLAYGKLYADFNSCGTFGCITSTKTGWTAGAGFEWAFAPNWSAKVEYLYVDLGKTFSDPASLGIISGKFNVIRAGLNYRFDWSNGSVVAKY